MSSLKQAFNEDFNREVVRGHFDVGAAPDTHRFYCLVDAKTGRREPKAVSGRPVPRADGKTGIEASAVSRYACDGAEQRGVLVTAGYVLDGIPAAPGGRPSPPAGRPEAHRPADGSPGLADVAGVKLGMSADEVRAVLRSKKLLNYFESMDALGAADSSAGAVRPGTGGRYLNVIAAWTPSAPAAAPAGDWESYKVMFTPVPGKERAMAIVHTTGYALDHGIREIDLQAGLVRKYGGTLLSGDSCNRREPFGGTTDWLDPASRVPNLALKTAPDEFRNEMEHCGTALVTEDHSTLNDTVPGPERIVTRFTVSAFSPAVAFEGATAAAQLMQTAGDGRSAASRIPDPTVPNL